MDFVTILELIITVGLLWAMFHRIISETLFKYRVLFITHTRLMTYIMEIFS
jgi:hypothetical protein